MAVSVQRPDAGTTPRHPIPRASLLAGGIAVALLTLGLMASKGFGVVSLAGATLAYALLATVIGLRFWAFHPHPRFGLANGLTLARAVLNCVLIGLILDPSALLRAWPAGLGWLVVTLAVTSFLLDGIDGYCARRRGETSRFGARFDIEIDAMLLSVLASLALVLGQAGPWVLLSGAAHYLFRTACRLLPWLARDLPPAVRRKAVSGLQGGALLLIVSPLVEPPLSDLIAAVALAALLASFVIDIRWLYRDAAR